jgi:cyclically-permuted mutarotase family protein
MMKKFFYLTFLYPGLLTSSAIFAQKKIKIRFSVAADLPANEKLGRQPGLAGAFTGCILNKLIIAGGANFPDSMPWQGGKKAYWNDIYVLKINKKGKLSWENSSSFKLKENIAYGASVQTRAGIVCIGGENENGISKKVFLLHTDNPDNKPGIIDLPDLPIPLTNLSAVAVGNIVYAAGGETFGSVSDKIFKLDLQKTGNGWMELHPLPVQVSHAVMLTYNDGVASHIYLLGGRKKNANSISDFYSSVFEYNIEKNEWIKRRDMPYAVSAGFGISNGWNSLLYIGGDKGETFHEVEKLLIAIASEKDELKKHQLIQQKNQLQINHPGFSKEILQYDVVKDEWKSAGHVAVDMPVTTQVAASHSGSFIPGGEIKAGIRTTQILKIAKLENFY